MRILLDTNILISAALFPNGTAAKAYIKAVTFPNKGIVCDWSIDELRRVHGILDGLIRRYSWEGRAE